MGASARLRGHRDAISVLKGQIASGFCTGSSIGSYGGSQHCVPVSTAASYLVCHTLREYERNVDDLVRRQEEVTTARWC